MQYQTLVLYQQQNILEESVYQSWPFPKLFEETSIFSCIRYHILPRRSYRYLLWLVLDDKDTLF